MSSARHHTFIATLAAAVLLAGHPAVAFAQATLNADLATLDAYVWRGLTFTNRPVLQPDAYVTVAAGKGSAVAGVALNVEPVAYKGVHDLSVLGTQAGTLVTATTLWAEYTRPVGVVSATGGITGYVYPHASGVADAYNTTEVYAKVAAGGPLAPSLAAYYDFVRVRGTYVEGALHHTVPASKRVAVTLGAAAGLSAGQGTDPAGRQTAYFAGSGLTHVDLSAVATWTAGAMTVAPSIHGLLLRDPATRLTAPDERHAYRVLLGVSVGWARALTHAHAAAAEVAAAPAAAAPHAPSTTSSQPGGHR